MASRPLICPATVTEPCDELTVMSLVLTWRFEALSRDASPATPLSETSSIAEATIVPPKPVLRVPPDKRIWLPSLSSTGFPAFSCTTHGVSTSPMLELSCPPVTVI